MIIHSIKWRLQAWHGFLLVCLVTGLMGGFYWFERQAKLREVDTDLSGAVTPLLPRLAPPVIRGADERGPGERRRPPPFEAPAAPEKLPRGEGPPPEARERDWAGLHSPRIYFVAWDERGEQFAASTNAPPAVPPPMTGSGPSRTYRTRGEWRELLVRVPSGRVVLTGQSLTPLAAELKRLALALVFLASGIVGLGLTVGWMLATRALRPIAEITRTARDIAAGDLSRRINVSETESELGQLATVLNSTFARLDSAFAQQQQFTSDAAHELRTPVTVILTQIQSTLNKERTGPEYRETLEACQRAAQRMRRLIESLLELARFDAGQERLRREPFDLAQTARECAEMVQPLAVAKAVRLHTELAGARCLGDAERLGQVLTNLLTNAVNYNRPGGEVRLSVKPEPGGAVITVADTGMGISAEDLPRVFERFYRGDRSRTEAQGSAGLGLAIGKAIVEAHGGTVELVSQPGQGTVVTVRLPA